MDIKLISCKYLTLLFSFSHSLGCLAAVRDPFVSCGDPSTPLMEEESNAALLLCYVALAFATLTGGRRWPVDSGPSSSQRGLWGGSSDSGRQQLLSVDTKAYASVRLWSRCFS